MLQSQLFTRVRKEAPKDEVARNAQLLIRGGFVRKEMAGVYAFLPLGLRVLEKIKNIIREELNAAGGQELHLTTLQSPDVWEKTNRWDDEVVDDWFKTELKNGKPLGLAFTHEEPLTNLMRDHIDSYKDLPIYAYQFQTKFRNELRAKSGIMRGREFLMKDLYDFSLDRESHEAFYEKMKEVYMRIFSRVGIGEQTYITLSSGGTFSKYSYEFQTLSDAGEDTILFDPEKKFAVNKDDYSEEIFQDLGVNKDDFHFQETKSIEVGDIYTLGEKYSKALGLTYRDAEGNDVPVYMGSYGIGVPRLMGTIVEIFADEKGLVWPEEIAPFRVHILSLDGGRDEKVLQAARELHDNLEKSGIETLLDDRDLRPGEKFAENDFLGIPYRVVVSARSLESGGFELKKRAEDDAAVVSRDTLVRSIRN